MSNLYFNNSVMPAD